MFNFFSSPKPAVNVIDKIWISKENKYEACMQMVQIQPMYQLVVWFENTQQELLEYISAHGGDQKVFTTSQINEITAKNQIPVIIEHYPLEATEQILFSQNGLQDVYVFSSMDEPLFMQFGGENIIRLMSHLGIQPHEEISHPSITRSISNAQKKIAKKVSLEKKAKSQQEWFDLNFKE
ncbi:MAG: hypothetical protein IPG60_06270 [Bacteroidetes bacterium]|nr:hypothetical protein [Bacteroidota bacterium]MBK7110337.1 hypothetical protein [Bacteroidota bacterium]MBK8488378.1 hypothetical protein [Bacteroidota bacterium]MBK8681858.1 hypothetical protein [Bacteroidota bacterium]